MGILEGISNFDKKIIELLPLNCTSEDLEKQFNLAFLSNGNFYIKKSIEKDAKKCDINHNIWGVLGKAIESYLDEHFKDVFKYSITINFSRLSNGRLAGFSIGFLEDWDKINTILANKNYGFGKLFLSHSHDGESPFIPACIFVYKSNNCYDVNFLYDVEEKEKIEINDYLDKNKSRLNLTLNSSFELIGSELGKNKQFVLYSPIIFDKNCRIGIQITCEKEDLNLEKISKFVSTIRPYLLAIERQLSVIETRISYSEQATKTAIGSIMSRNGSHNIGSHVLSSLSHHVGTMPDDRILYQYIQHRMDYIATATTEFPKWTTPTLFVGGIMKNFYSQKHLLDYISRSEGLHAYKFQERNLDDAARMNQHGTIRIFLRRFYDLNEIDQKELPLEHRYLMYDSYDRAWSIYYFFGEKDKMFRQKFSDDKRIQYEISESGGTAKFLEYDDKYTPNWNEDVRVAIPGGIVGQHAFYTIIENVIRNAAKHGWASEINFSEKDLEIYLDFQEKKRKEEIIFTVGDNVSDVFGGAKEFWNEFFKIFSCSDKENPLGYWRKFCCDNIDLAKTIKKNSKPDKNRSNDFPNPWDGVWERLFPVGFSMPKSKMEEESIEKLEADKEFMSKVLLKAFVSPLKDEEAKQLDGYLSSSSKEIYVDDKQLENHLPLIYRLQRIYLLNELAKFNVKCFFEPKENPQKGWRPKKGTDIINAIKLAFFEGFDEILSKDTKFAELCKPCSKWEKIFNLLQSKDDNAKKELEENLQKVLDKSQLNAILSIIDDSQNLVYDETKIKSQCQYIIYKFLLSRVSNEWEYYKFLTTNLSNNHKWELGHRLILPLHHDQQRKLAQSFIDSDGKLRKENWGLAEIKISAGYLSQRDISEIGGLNEKGNNIVVPITMPGVCHNAYNPHNCLSCSEKRKMPCYTDSNCPLTTHKFHLGYQFKIAKPKDILVILGCNDELPKKLNGNWEKFMTRFGGNGVDFAFAKRIEEKDKFVRFDYYKIIDSQGKYDLIKTLNYRYTVISESLLKVSTLEDKRKQKDIIDEENRRKKVIDSQFCFRHILCKDVTFNTKDNSSLDFILSNSKDDIINQIIEKNKIDDKNKTNGAVVLRKAVLSAWIKKIAKNYSKLDNNPVRLIVNVDGNESDSAHGLITREDLLKTMFVECYHTSLISFLKNPPKSLELSDTTKHLINLLALIKVMPDDMVKPQQDYGHGDDEGAKEYIRDQLVAYCNLLKTHLHLSVEFVEAIKSIETDTVYAKILRKIEDIDNNFERSIARRIYRCKKDEDETIRKGSEDLIVFLKTIDKVDFDFKLDSFHGDTDEYYYSSNSNSSKNDSYLSGRHSFEDNIRAIVNACSAPEEDVFSALVESLNSMFLASDVYLRKYEERISTLPEAYKHDGRDKIYGKESKEKDVQQIADELLLGKTQDGNISNDKNGNRKIIKYSRHDKAKPEGAIYAEALSGSQSYLNALSRLISPIGKDQHGERYAAVARLLENAFLRILIIDERVMNFVEEHSYDEMKETFINMGIWIADIEKHAKAKSSLEVKKDLYTFSYFDLGKKNNDDGESICVDIDKDQFDILVIHQGIIDKWWGHDKKKVKNVLDALRRSIPKVVVTTGRGRPENIPDDEKVIPFSVIESSLFRRYPEKLIFINTIMNLLPYGKQE